MKQRLQKFLANAGVASRRASEELIRQGRVRINGTIASLGDGVEQGDAVLVDNHPVQSDGKVYYMLNKPAGYTTTVKDPHAKHTVLELLPDVSQRVYPVGRLDRDTEGLLIFTNDGELTQQLLHPSKHVPKTYFAQVAGKLTPAEANRLEQGILLEEGMTAPARVENIQHTASETTLTLTIYEGRKRQVRRMCASVGHPVIYLKRLSVGSLSLGNLPTGNYRALSAQEVQQLYEDGEKR